MVAVATEGPGANLADFGNTARFAWDLPEGVTVSSASGVFMTAPVPEPTPTALLAAGLIGFLWLRRQRAGGAAAR